MTNLKNIIRRAIDNGFDLSFVKNYDEKVLLQGLYDFLVKNRYYCSMDGDVIYVGPDIIEDVAEIRIQNKTMRIKALTDRGFFDTLVTLFKYVRHLSEQVGEDSDEDISTETDELKDDDESSEEMWL